MGNREDPERFALVPGERRKVLEAGILGDQVFGDFYQIVKGGGSSWYNFFVIIKKKMVSGLEGNTIGLAKNKGDCREGRKIFFEAPQTIDWLKQPRSREGPSLVCTRPKQVSPATAS